MGVTDIGEGQFPVTRAVKWLLALNVGVYFVALVVFGTAHATDVLAFDAEALPGGWWTLLTYMFVHAGFVHLALNMFILWSFGPRLEHTWGTRAFTTYYLWCGIGGAVTHLLLVRAGLLVGASAAIYGVMLAYAVTWKDDEVLLFGVLPIRARWLALWLVGINLFYGALAVRGQTNVAAFAHLGGLLFGWLYLRGPAAGTFERVRESIESVPDDTGEMPRVVPRRGRRARERNSIADEVVERSRALMAAARSVGGPEGDRRAAELDAVLDKISRSGLDSLAQEERRLLERLSREMRGR